MAAEGEAMKRRVLNRWLVGGGVLVLAGLCLLTWPAARRHDIALKSIPQRPALKGWPGEMQDEITDAEERAGSYLGSTKGLIALSRLFHANGFYDEAMQCYAGLQQMQPGEARWRHLQASVLAGLGRLDEALPFESAAVDLAPEYIAARLRLGDIRLKTNRTDLAIDAYNEVLRRSPGNPYALLGLAKCQIALGNWNKARDNLREGVKLHPDFIGGLSLMATVAEHFGDLGEANELRERIGRREFSDLPDPWLDDLLNDCYDPYRLSVVSVVVGMAGESARARQLLERASTLAPQNNSYHRQLAVLLSDSGDLISARRQFEQAVALSPTDADSWLLLYQLLGRIGDTAAAEKTLAGGLANCPDSASLHMERARLWKSAGRPAEAVAEFQEAYRLNPSEAQPMVELASVFFAINQGDAALSALHEALRKQPEHPMALATLAFYYISAGDEANASKWWSHVRRQPRTPPQTVDALKQAFRQHFGHNAP